MLDIQKAKMLCITRTERILSEYEKEYPDDYIPRKFLDAIKLYIDGKITKEEFEVMGMGYKIPIIFQADIVWAAYAAIANAAYAASSKTTERALSTADRITSFAERVNVKMQGKENN